MDLESQSKSLNFVFDIITIDPNVQTTRNEPIGLKKKQ